MKHPVEPKHPAPPTRRFCLPQLLAQQARHRRQPHLGQLRPSRSTGPGVETRRPVRRQHRRHPSSVPLRRQHLPVAERDLPEHAHPRRPGAPGSWRIHQRHQRRTDDCGRRHEAARHQVLRDENEIFCSCGRGGRDGCRAGISVPILAGS